MEDEIFVIKLTNTLLTRILPRHTEKISCYYGTEKTGVPRLGILRYSCTLLTNKRIQRKKKEGKHTTSFSLLHKEPDRTVKYSDLVSRLNIRTVS